MKVRTKVKIALGVVLLGAVAAGSAVAYKLVQKKWHLWLPAYVAGNEADTPVPPGTPIDIIFAHVDHYEPYVGYVEQSVEEARVREWCERFPQLASRHRDADGVPPQHTFFYPYDQMDLGLLRQLSDLCYQRLGEIEVHLHHVKDTEATLTAKFEDCLENYARVGALVFPGSPLERRFGFIHGNWALDNSIRVPPEGRDRCGVNNELIVLSRLGCYADFTFPAVGTDAQPHTINQIFYATDDPEQPKSYDTGVEVQVGREESGDLMIVQGPLLINLKDWRHHYYPACDDGSITNCFPPEPLRVDAWIDMGIHVRGRPEWIFVKAYSHGASDPEREACLGEPSDRMFTYLEERYNDGEKYRLHYVTAREMYNMIKAAEASKSGNPNAYRDYVIPPPLNRRVNCSTLYEPVVFQDDRLEVAWDGPTDIEMQSRLPRFRAVQGRLSRLKFDLNEDAGWAEWVLEATRPVRLEAVLPEGTLEATGGSIEARQAVEGSADVHCWLLTQPIAGEARQTVRVSWTPLAVSSARP